MRRLLILIVFVSGCGNDTDEIRNELRQDRAAIDALSKRLDDYNAQLQRTADPRPCVPGEATGSGSATQSLHPVYVVSEPPGATITVDGDVVGTTPATITPTRETFHLRLDKKGYEPVERDVKRDSSGSVVIALTKIS